MNDNDVTIMTENMCSRCVSPRMDGQAELALVAGQLSVNRVYSQKAVTKSGATINRQQHNLVQLTPALR